MQDYMIVFMLKVFSSSHFACDIVTFRDYHILLLKYDLGG